MDKSFFIGCSGYYYPSWKNNFYPTGVQPKNWLEYYSSVFDTVELNGTFYRTPKLSDLERYANVTPHHFKFSVKMSKYITHILKLKQSTQQIKEFQELIKKGLGNKLSCFLFQLPPSFHYNDENMERIIDNIPHHPHNIVELRHISWWNDSVKNILTEKKITFCNVDFPKLQSHFIQTTDLFYLRLHGNPVLFKSSYTKKQLENFQKKFPEHCNHYMIYFNNTYYDAAYKNALQLKNITKD